MLLAPDSVSFVSESLGLVVGQRICMLKTNIKVTHMRFGALRAYLLSPEHVSASAVCVALIALARL